MARAGRWPHPRAVPEAPLRVADLFGEIEQLAVAQGARRPRRGRAPLEAGPL